MDTRYDVPVRPDRGYTTLRETSILQLPVSPGVRRWIDYAESESRRIQNARRAAGGMPPLPADRSAPGFVDPRLSAWQVFAADEHSRSIDAAPSRRHVQVDGEDAQDAAVEENFDVEFPLDEDDGNRWEDAVEDEVLLAEDPVEHVGYEATPEGDEFRHDIDLQQLTLQQPSGPVVAEQHEVLWDDPIVVTAVDRMSLAENEHCPICWELYHADEDKKVVRLQCHEKHYFHEECIVAGWLSRRMTCRYAVHPLGCRWTTQTG